MNPPDRGGEAPFARAETSNMVSGQYAWNQPGRAATRTGCGDERQLQICYAARLPESRCGQQRDS